MQRIISVLLCVVMHTYCVELRVVYMCCVVLIVTQEYYVVVCVMLGCDAE